MCLFYFQLNIPSLSKVSLFFFSSRKAKTEHIGPHGPWEIWKAWLSFWAFPSQSSQQRQLLILFFLSCPFLHYMPTPPFYLFIFYQHRPQPKLQMREGRRENNLPLFFYFSIETPTLKPGIRIIMTYNRWSLWKPCETHFGKVKRIMLFLFSKF